MMSEAILKKLEVTREKMIQSGIENGLLSEETLRLSRKLDFLLNQYQKHSNDFSDHALGLQTIDD